MKKFRSRLLSITLVAALMLGLTACGDGAGDTKESGGEKTEGDAAVTTERTEVPDFSEAEVKEIDANQPTGTIKWLGYYDLENDQPDQAASFKEKYDGDIESEICGSGAEYFEALATRVSSDLSPDVVRYEWMSFPHGISKNLYTPLDTYIDMNDPIWEGVLTAIERFEYAGKHYYYPQRISTSFALNYNKEALEYEGIPDPMDLYLEGKWDWNAFKDLLVKWCNLGEEYVGYTGVGGMSFTATTGVKVIDVKEDGTIVNNLKNPDIQRCMDFLEDLFKQSLVGEGYVAPESAFLDGKLLFLGMEPTWTYGAAQQALTRQGIDNDLGVLPFPRDPNSDTYTIAYDTYGYMVPSGAQNIKGAIDWIICGRADEVDPENMAKAKESALDTSPIYYPKCSVKECSHVFTEDEKNMTTCPDCGTERKVRFKVTYTEQQYDILQDMKDFSKFNLIFDDVYGFGTTLTDMFDNNSGENGSLLNGPIFLGSSYTQLREIYFESVESLLQPYREKLALDNQAN